MTIVKQLLEEKGSDVWTVSPEDRVIDALNLMADKNIGALIVTEDDNVVGILSERDYARKVELQGKSADDTRVREIMTRDVICTRPSNTIEECMALMTSKRIRHLPVLKDDRLAGVISIGDVVKTVISQQEFIIEQLENYIVTSST